MDSTPEIITGEPGRTRYASLYHRFSVLFRRLTFFHNLFANLGRMVYDVRALLGPPPPGSAHTPPAEPQEAARAPCVVLMRNSMRRVLLPSLCLVTCLLAPPP